MFRISLVSFLALGILAGCGTNNGISASTASSNKTSGAVVLNAAGELRFQSVSIADLTATWDNSKNNGKKVTFEGSFGPEIYTVAYMVTNYGYKLWDHSGHGIRVRNIYTQVRPGAGPGGTIRDNGRDFNNATRPRLISYGHYVKIEGTYVAGYDDSSHGGSFRVPPSIDVWFINGKPTSDYVSK